MWKGREKWKWGWNSPGGEAVEGERREECWEAYVIQIFQHPGWSIAPPIRLPLRELVSWTWEAHEAFCSFKVFQSPKDSMLYELYGSGGPPVVQKAGRGLYRSKSSFFGTLQEGLKDKLGIATHHLTWFLYVGNSSILWNKIWTGYLNWILLIVSLHIECQFRYSVLFKSILFFSFLSIFFLMGTYKGSEVI